jgi:branched-chain amino acid transport system substrate-binding protein
MKFAMKAVAVGVMLAGVSVAFAQKGEVVKMVRIDPLTGLLGPVGVSQPRATSSSPRSSAAPATRPA